MEQYTGTTLREYEGYRSGPHFDCPLLAEKAFGKDLASQQHLTAMAYLYRRFGPPFWGCDSYKEIASYVLTTKIDGLLLDVGCLASCLRYYFSVLYSKELAKQFSPYRSLPNLRLLQCQKELLMCMRDLLTPVNVRDVVINVLGEILGDSYPKNIVPPSKYAGLGCNRAALDKLLTERV